MPEETCGYGESDRTTMVFVESFFFSLIVRSLSGDLNILVLFSFHQFEGLPVKTDNGVCRPIRSSHQRKFLGVHIFLLHFTERKIEDMEPNFLKCEVSLSFPGIQIIYEYII